jgi:hypothetical protein
VICISFFIIVSDILFELQNAACGERGGGLDIDLMVEEVKQTLKSGKYAEGLGGHLRGVLKLPLFQSSPVPAADEALTREMYAKASQST